MMITVPLRLTKTKLDNAESNLVAYLLFQMLRLLTQSNDQAQVSLVWSQTLKDRQTPS